MSTRRAFLSSTAALSAAAAAACAKPAGDSAKGAAAANAEDELDGEPISPITPNDTFYHVTYSGWLPPEGYREAWTLTVVGLDGTETVYTAAELEARGGEEVEHTLECIGSSSGRSISNARWRGIRMATLLGEPALLGETPAKYLNFFCGDDYHTAVPAADFETGIMLVWEMNGVPLPDDHGGPVRVLTPGRYGMKNPKWIERIELSDEADVGTWESRGWSDTCIYQVSSWIHAPAANAVVPLAGVWMVGSAFAGSIPITTVEVSDDGGQSWTEVEITYQNGPDVWTLWRYFWIPPEHGVYELMVRAKDESGRVQTAAEEYDSDLDGFEGIFSIAVTVA